MCLYVWVFVEVSGELEKIRYLLLPHGTWGLNSGHRACWQTHLSVEPPQEPRSQDFMSVLDTISLTIFEVNISVKITYIGCIDSLLIHLVFIFVFINTSWIFIMCQAADVHYDQKK